MKHARLSGRHSLKITAIFFSFLFHNKLNNYFISANYYEEREADRNSFI